MATPTDQIKNVMEEVLDEGYTLVAPRRRKQPKSPRINKDPCVTPDVHIYEVEGGLIESQLEMLRNSHVPNPRDGRQVQTVWVLGGESAEIVSDASGEWAC
jgi:hypothetical protein